MEYTLNCIHTHTHLYIYTQQKNTWLLGLAPIQRVPVQIGQRQIMSVYQFEIYSIQPGFHLYSQFISTQHVKEFDIFCSDGCMKTPRRVKTNTGKLEGMATLFRATRPTFPTSSSFLHPVRSSHSLPSCLQLPLSPSFSLYPTLVSKHCFCLFIE